MQWLFKFHGISFGFIELHKYLLSFKESQEIFETHRRARTVQNISVFNTFSNWIVLYWAVLSCAELHWAALRRIELVWTPSGLCWLVLNSAELSCIELVWPPIELYWHASKSAELRAELRKLWYHHQTTIYQTTIYQLPSTITNRAPKWGHLYSQYFAHLYAF